jgi:hypothetical protein
MFRDTFIIWAVMTFVPAVVLNPFDMQGFLAMSKVTGAIFGVLLSLRLVLAQFGHRSHGTGEGDWPSDDYAPGVSHNPSSGSMMANSVVDIEGRGIGQGYDS